MGLSDLANLSTIIAAVALVVTAWLLFHELRTNNRLVKAANTQALVALSSPFNLTLIQDRNLAELFTCGASNYESLDFIDQYRYKGLLRWWLIYYENVYYQWRQGMLDNLSYEPWSMDLRLFLEQHNLGSHWKEIRSQYQAEFADHVSRMIATMEVQERVGTFSPRTRSRNLGGFPMTGHSPGSDRIQNESSARVPAGF